MSNRILIASNLIFAMVLAWYVSGAEAQFVREGLVSWWSFDKSTIGNDGTVEDGFGDNNGTIEGDAEIAEGVAGECLEFDGVDDFVTIPHSDSLDMGQDSLSLEAWIKAPIQPVSWWLNTIYGKGGTNWKAGYLIAARGDLDPGLLGGFTVLVSAAGGGTETHTEKDINDDQWHHVVGVFSRSAGEIRGYVDGKLEQSAAADKNLDLTTEAEARIGRSSQQSDSADWYAGLIDEVRLYSKALSDDEVKQNFERGTAVAPSAEKLSITWGWMKQR